MDPRAGSGRPRGRVVGRPGGHRGRRSTGVLENASDETVEGEGWHERADGSVFWGTLRLSPLSEDRGSRPSAGTPRKERSSPTVSYTTSRPLQVTARIHAVNGVVLRRLGGCDRQFGGRASLCCRREDFTVDSAVRVRAGFWSSSACRAESPCSAECSEQVVEKLPERAVHRARAL